MPDTPDYLKTDSKIEVEQRPGIGGLTFSWSVIVDSTIVAHCLDEATADALRGALVQEAKHKK